MDALGKLQKIVDELMTAEGEEKDKLLTEAKELIRPAQEEVELNECLKRIELEHTFGIRSED